MPQGIVGTSFSMVLEKDDCELGEEGNEDVVEIGGNGEQKAEPPSTEKQKKRGRPKKKDKKDKKDKNAAITNIDNVKDFVEEAGLFENHKIILVKGCKGIDEKNLENIKNSHGVFIFKF